MSAEVVEQERDSYDCNTCRLLEMQEALWPENAEAWEAYGPCSTPFVTERGLAPVVFRRCIAHRPWDEVLDLLDRLSIIEGVLRPPSR